MLASYLLYLQSTRITGLWHHCCFYLFFHSPVVFSCVGPWVCVFSIQMNECTCVCRYSCLGRLMWKPEAFWYLHPPLSTVVFDSFSLTESIARLVSHETHRAQLSSPLCPAGFYNPKLGIHAFKVSTVTGEPPPQSGKEGSFQKCMDGPIGAIHPWAGPGVLYFFCIYYCLYTF